MEYFVYGILPYGHCECSIFGCFQRVQDGKEFDGAKKPMCYAHAKMRDKLFARAAEYASGDDRATTQDWDLEVGNGRNRHHRRS